MTKKTLLMLAVMSIAAGCIPAAGPISPGPNHPANPQAPTRSVPTLSKALTIEDADLKGSEADAKEVAAAGNHHHHHHSEEHAGH